RLRWSLRSPGCRRQLSLLEMPAKLTITPAVMQVSAKGGTTKHRLKCVGDQRVVFKVKLKAKYYKFYKVWPVMGFIQPGATREITFTRKPGRIGKDYLVIQYIIAPSGYDPREPFVKGAQIGKLIFKIEAVEGDPMHIEETTYRGDVITDAGQDWKRAVNRDEDERIEREIAAQYDQLRADVDQGNLDIGAETPTGRSQESEGAVSGVIP
uniref:Major sperm protein n=1 Tax=Parascaris univalens TaxID=6257 RepID=A0A915C954_PARUN